MNIETCLEKLIKYLEKLSKNSIDNINDVINKINKYHSICDNELQKMKFNNKPITNNQYIENLLNTIKIYKMKTNQYFHNLFNLVENLLNRIKQYNLQVVNSSPALNIDPSKLTISSDLIKNNKQIQTSLQKQKIIQAQELKLLNDNQGRALSALECYANKFSKDKKTNYFDYYNMNNMGNKKDQNQLRGQCIVQTQLFKMSYDDYTKKYGPYKLDNLDNNKLLQIINGWMDKVNNNDKILYKEMRDIIISSNNSSLSSNSFNIYSKNCQNAMMNPRDIASMAPGIYNYNHQSSKEAKKNYMETGEMTSKLIIGQSYKDDKNAELLMQQIRDNQQFYDEEEEIQEFGFK